MMNRTTLHLLLSAAIFLLFSCVHDPIYVVPDDGEFVGTGNNDDPPIVITGEEGCDPDTVYFQNQILPIFIGSCAVTGCHDLTTREEDLALIDYRNIMKGIRPGDPKSSKYFKVITLEETDDLMPLDPVTKQGFRLPADQIALIEKWINQNASNNFCESCDTSNYSFSVRIEGIFRTSCATSIGCHASGSKNGPFTTYPEIKPFIDNGFIADRVISKQDMPISAPLPACDMEVLIKWIEDGAPNN